MRFKISLVLSFVLMWIITQTPVLPAEKEKIMMEIKSIVPLKIGDYKSDGRDEFYDRKTSFRYMDGAAELYRSYAFSLLIVRKYVKRDQPSIIVELFDMGSSADAFGIFSYETGEEEVGIGQGSDYGGGLLRFWKGKYFANVFAEKETPDIKRDILTLGEAIAKNIRKEGPKPRLIQLLPEEGLLERSIRYFHLHPILNHHYFLSHENILHLGSKTNAVLVDYPSSDEKAKIFLLLIQYPEQKLAEKAFNSFLKAYMPEATSSKAVKTENGKWTSARQYLQYIIVVFDSPSDEKAEQLIGEVAKKLLKK